MSTLASSLRGGWGTATAALATGGAVGIASAAGGLALLVAAGALAGLGLLLAGRRIPSLFLALLAALLAGYAFLDRGLAYAGVGSIYVGEAVLGLGLLALVLSLPRVRIAGAEVALTLFMGWGLARTVPYVGQYGLDAFRDAVQWGYAVFALLVIWLLDRPRIEALVRVYGRLVVLLALWIPAAIVLTQVFYDRIPAFPGSEVPIIYLKAGDAGVHLAGIAAFVLAGLAPTLPLAREAVLWSAWAVSAGIVSALNRGAMIAAGSTVLVALFARKFSRWLALGCAAVLALSAALVVNPTVDVGSDRRLSVEQVVVNAIGIFSDADSRNSSTKEWRAEWWGDIVEYTVRGPHFWAGKGFGINLADDDGFQVEADNSLRAPHSAHFEFLARGGVPGLALWLLVLATFAASVVAGARRAARAGDRFLVGVLGWLFVYWLAAVLNMSVDVYLGGPQGGITFWCLYGAGIAAARLAGRRDAEVAAVARATGPDAARTAARPIARPTPPDAEAGGSPRVVG